MLVDGPPRPHCTKGTLLSLFVVLRRRHSSHRSRDALRRAACVRAAIAPTSTPTSSELSQPARRRRRDSAAARVSATCGGVRRRLCALDARERQQAGSSDVAASAHDVALSLAYLRGAFEATNDATRGALLALLFAPNDATSSLAEAVLGLLVGRRALDRRRRATVMTTRARRPRPSGATRAARRLGAFGAQTVATNRRRLCALRQRYAGVFCLSVSFGRRSIADETANLFAQVSKLAALADVCCSLLRQACTHLLDTYHVRVDARSLACRCSSPSLLRAEESVPANRQCGHVGRRQIQVASERWCRADFIHLLTVSCYSQRHEGADADGARLCAAHVDAQSSRSSSTTHARIAASAPLSMRACRAQRSISSSLRCNCC